MRILGLLLLVLTPSFASAANLGACMLKIECQQESNSVRMLLVYKNVKGKKVEMNAFFRRAHAKRKRELAQIHNSCEAKRDIYLERYAMCSL